MKRVTPRRESARWAVLLGAGLAIHCGFPSVNFEEGDGGHGDGGFNMAPLGVDGAGEDGSGTVGEGAASVTLPDGASAGSSAPGNPVPLTSGSSGSMAELGSGATSSGPVMAGPGSGGGSSDAMTGPGSGGSSDAMTGPGAAMRDASSGTGTGAAETGSQGGAAADVAATEHDSAAPVPVPSSDAMSGEIEAAPPPPRPDAATTMTCDVDQDGYAASGATCGGMDCDDSDRRAHPGVMQFLIDLPTATTKGDWNCDGRVETQYPTLVVCDVIAVGSCNATAGFTDAPGCGQASSNFVQCKAIGKGNNGNGALKLCVVDPLSTSTRTQACR